MAADPKIYGFKRPLEADDIKYISASICFPDKIEYRAAWRGQMNMLGKWYQWAHTQADYQDPPLINRQIAEIWAECLANATMEECVEFCARIIDCITNDTDVRNALSSFISNHPDGTIYPKQIELPTTAKQGNVLVPNPSCDKALIWGQCVGIVRLADRMISDFFDTWETYTNSGEVVSAIASGIPLLAEATQASGVAGILEYANSVQSAIRENYSADYDIAYENALACEFFCIARQCNGLSIDDMRGVLNDRVGASLSLSNVAELLVSVFDLDISGFNVADIYMALFFNALALGNLVIPVTWGIEQFNLLISVLNEPSDDYLALCLDCPDAWVHTFDFAENDGGFVSSPLGQYSGGVWADSLIQFPSNSYRGIEILRENSVPTTVSRVELLFAYTAGQLNPTGDYTSFISIDGGEQHRENSPAVPASPIIWEGAASFVSSIRIGIMCGVGGGFSDPSGSAALEKIIISGEGANPFL